jgi:hypothetical protein
VRGGGYKYRARICKRLRSPAIDSKESIPKAYICSLAGRYVKEGCRTGTLDWESLPRLLKRFTNSGSGYKSLEYTCGSQSSKVTRGIFVGNFKYFIERCFMCRHSDTTVSEDTVTERRTVATLLLTGDSLTTWKYISPTIGISSTIG